MSRSSRGIALKIGSTLAFTLQYMSIKLAGDVPIGQVIFFRASFALVPVLLLAQYTIGMRATLHTNKPLLHIGRSLIGLTGMFLNFASLKLLPLADVTGYGFVQPIFAVILAALLLKESVGPYRAAAVVIAFTGVLMMLQPQGGLIGIFAGGFSTGAAIALSSALIGAFVVIFIRQMSASERGETIVFYFMVTCASVGALTMLWNRVPVTPDMAFWLVLAGFFGGFGQLGMTFSYRNAEPSLLAPFDYLAMVWAVVIGFFVFGEIPETLVLAGTGIVIAAGIFIAWREHRLGRELVSRAQSV
jgi:drug/metabolite transporter (DMT)-like permease